MRVLLKLTRNLLLYPSIKKVIRAYRTVHAKGDPLFLGRVYEALTLRELNCGSDQFSKFFLGGLQAHAEICLRQILLKRLICRSLNARILICITNPEAKLVYPLPNEWIKLLSAHGIRVAKCRSALLFRCFALLFFAYGVLQSTKEYILRIWSGEKIITRPYVHFIGIEKKNIPIINNPDSFTIVDWYLNWAGRIFGLRSVTHEVRDLSNELIKGIHVATAPIYMIRLTSLRSRVGHFFWCVWVFFYVLIQAFMGRLAGLLLFREAILTHRVEQLGTIGRLADEYMFSCSQHIHRPLWTYAAEQSGSQVTMYYYSVSMPFIFRGKRPRMESGLQSMTWQRILTFSKNHRDYLEEATQSRIPIELVTPIYFSDYVAKVPTYDKKNVAVFDVTPVRMAERALLAPADDYRTAEVGIRFLEDLYTVLASNGYSLIWKKKRTTSSIHSKIYANYTSSFKTRPGVIEVHSDVAASRVIDSCAAVISMAFTSTAVFAHSSKKPSIFYDPTGDLFAGDSAAFGLPLIVGVSELSDWVHNLNPTDI
jgi:polysaccharide biosynthesis PFTS motif protein